MQEASLPGLVLVIGRKPLAKALDTYPRCTLLPLGIVCIDITADQGIIDPFLPQFLLNTQRSVSPLDTVVDKCLGEAIIGLQAFPLQIADYLLDQCPVRRMPAKLSGQFTGTVLAP